MDTTKQDVELKFIVTGDVHGSIFQYDFIENEMTKASLSQINTYITEQKENKSQELILLDLGDFLQGQPIVFYSNKFYEKYSNFKHICAEVMNYMQYDAATIGNHDIEAGHEVYDRLIKDFNFPLLAANAINKETNKHYFEPYTIINKKGVKIAVLGLITPAIPLWLPEIKWLGIEFEDMVESAKKWVAYIKETEKPDLLIGLFHAGIDYTYNRQNKDTLKNENASLLVAEQVPGFDAIFAGHDHQENNLKVTNTEGKKVIILNPKSQANFVSVLTVKMVYNSLLDVYETYDITGLNLQMDFCEKDPAFNSRFKEQIATVKKYVSEPICIFKRSINSREALFGDTGFVDLIHIIQLEYSNADISFAAPLSFDTRIKKGRIFVRDLFKLYKFDNLLYVIWLTGQEIKDYLEYSYDLWFNGMRTPNDFLLRFKSNYKGELVMSEKYYNFSSAGGINYTVNLRKPYGKKIEIAGFSDGTPFELDKKYKVALNSYRGNGGGGHLIEGSKIPHEELHQRIIFKSEKDIRSIIMEWLKEKEEITPMALGHWRAIPKSWWYNGRRKSIKILFGT